MMVIEVDAAKMPKCLANAFVSCVKASCSRSHPCIFLLLSHAHRGYGGRGAQELRGTRRQTRHPRMQNSKNNYCLGEAGKRWRCYRDRTKCLYVYAHTRTSTHARIHCYLPPLYDVYMWNTHTHVKGVLPKGVEKDVTQTHTHTNIQVNVWMDKREVALARDRLFSISVSNNTPHPTTRPPTHPHSLPPSIGVI